MATKTKPMSFRAKTELATEIEAAARREGLSVSEYMRRKLEWACDMLAPINMSGEDMMGVEDGDMEGEGSHSDVGGR